jgi:hypothetical protein
MNWVILINSKSKCAIMLSATINFNFNNCDLYQLLIMQYNFNYIHDVHITFKHAHLTLYIIFISLLFYIYYDLTRELRIINIKTWICILLDIVQWRKYQQSKSLTRQLDFDIFHFLTPLKFHFSCSLNYEMIFLTYPDNWILEVEYNPLMLTLQM